MNRHLTHVTGEIARIWRGSPDRQRPPALLVDEANDNFATLAARLLREHPAIRLDALIDRLAEQARLDDLRLGGWAVDSGLWGPELYRREAAAAVQRLVGRSLALADDGGWLATPTTEPARGVEPSPVTAGDGWPRRVSRAASQTPDQEEKDG